MTYDGKQALSQILFSVRTPLVFFEGMTMLIKEPNSEEIPTIIMLWLDKWLPYIKSLQQEERKLIKYTFDTNDSVDFDLLITGFGEKMDDIAILCTELEELPSTNSHVMKQLIRAMQVLEEIHQKIQSRHYKSFFGV